jgi:hypothetical protein
MVVPMNGNGDLYDSINENSDTDEAISVDGIKSPDSKKSDNAELKNICVDITAVFLEFMILTIFL